MSIILALITGICISVMILSNGSLESYVGNFPSLIIIHTAGLFLTGLMFIKKSNKSQPREKKSKWFYFAGTLGIAVVALNNKIFSMGGVLLTLGGTLTGQVIMATIMELFKHKKDNTKLPLGKVLSLVLIIPGGVIIGLRSNLPFYWIMLSWIPGALVLIQSYMNSQNILSIGFKKTLLVHYLSALVFLIIALSFIPFADGITKIISGEVPKQIVVGGGFIAVFVVSIGSYLLLRLKPITYVLLVYSGQLASAIVIDYATGHPLSPEKIIAMVLIISGLFLGETKKLK